VAGWGRVVLRELRWFGLAFVLPFVAIVGLELALSRSPLPLWRRLTTLEDTCAYGACVLIPGLVYVAVTMTRLLRRRPSP